MSEWKTYKIKEITTKVGSGSTPKGGQKVYQKSGTALIRSQNVYNFTFVKEGLVFINDSSADKLKNVTLKEKDILLNITGDSVGRCCIVPKELLPARVNQHVAIIRTDINNCPDFLMYALNERSTKERLLNQVHGGTRKALTKSIIEEFIVKVPSLETQNKIASILKSIDKKIKLNIRINFTLEQIAIALYKNWFIDFGPFQDGEFTNSELGEIPKGWGIKTLKDISNILMGQSPKSEFYNLKGEGLPFHQGVANFGVRFPTNTIYSSKLLRVAEEGDFLISVRAPVGRINIAHTKMVIGRGLSAISSKTDDSSFLFYTLKTIFNEEDKYGSGTIFNSINKGELENLKVIVPPETIIKEYESKISIYDSLIRRNHEQILLLTDTRDYLLPRLLSGEIDVSEAVEIVREAISNEQPEPSVRV